ncbi:MAG: hypothetical protein FJX75_26915 [Armatimonadetes bacterium]|nr:hypothetical protein [Armatimonadota bacterium]
MAGRREQTRAPRRAPTPTVRRMPDFASYREAAAWLESEEAERFLADAPLVPIRFVPMDPTLIPVTIRLPAELRDRMRRLASEQSMGYQTLARQWLLERCAKEEAKAQRKPSKRKPRAPKAQQVDQAAG